MKDLKYEHQSTFPLWGRVKLNFRDRHGKPNIYSENSSHYQVSSSNSQKLSLWCKKNHYPPRWICMTHIWSPTLLPRRIMIFQGVLNKFPFFIKISISGKNCQVKLNFRDRYGKPNIYSKNSAAVNFFKNRIAKK